MNLDDGDGESSQNLNDVSNNDDENGEEGSPNEDEESSDDDTVDSPDADAELVLTKADIQRLVLRKDQTVTLVSPSRKKSEVWKLFKQIQI